VHTYRSNFANTNSLQIKKTIIKFKFFCRKKKSKAYRNMTACLIAESLAKKLIAIIKKRDTK